MTSLRREKTTSCCSPDELVDKGLERAVQADKAGREMRDEYTRQRNLRAIVLGGMERITKKKEEVEKLRDEAARFRRSRKTM